MTLKNILVMPGDLIIADDSGICVIPFDLVETVLRNVKSILREEEHMRNIIFEKRPLNELRPLYRKRYK